MPVTLFAGWLSLVSLPTIVKDTRAGIRTDLPFRCFQVPRTILSDHSRSHTQRGVAARLFVMRVGPGDESILATDLYPNLSRWTVLDLLLTKMSKGASFILSGIFSGRLDSAKDCLPSDLIKSLFVEPDFFCLDL